MKRRTKETNVILKHVPPAFCRLYDLPSVTLRPRSREGTGTRSMGGGVPFADPIRKPVVCNIHCLALCKEDHLFKQNNSVETPNYIQRHNCDGPYVVVTW